MLKRSQKYGRDNDLRQMFSSIARRYDTTNRWITWGQDLRWRRELLDKVRLPHGGMLLDVGAGTGDLSLEAKARDKNTLVVGIDLTPAMLQMGRQKEGGELVHWVNGDALDLPYPCGVFDAVVSGYLLRNVLDVERALIEQYRVLKNGGQVVCLDTTPPACDAWHQPVRLYLRYVLPFIGGMVAGDAEAY